VHLDEIPIGGALVRRLVSSQFPALREVPIREVRSTGTVNAIYRIGDELCARLPRVETWARDLDKEFEWLPRLGPRLPLRVPEPVFKGVPDEDYPFSWAIYRWLEGEPYDGASDERAAARSLAVFVRALRALDLPADAPRGGRPPLADVDAMTREALEDDAALAAWERALDAPVWDGERVWIHADLLRPNLLVRDGRMDAVIDFGGVGAGDPALDVIPAWAVFGRAGRAAYREALGVEDGVWERGRGYALHQAAMIIPYYRETNPGFVVHAQRTVAEVLTPE